MLKKNDLLSNWGKESKFNYYLFKIVHCLKMGENVKKKWIEVFAREGSVDLQHGATVDADSTLSTNVMPGNTFYASPKGFKNFHDLTAFNCVLAICWMVYH